MRIPRIAYVILLSLCCGGAAVTHGKTVRKIVDPRTGSYRLESAIPGLTSFARLDSIREERELSRRLRDGAMAPELAQRLLRMRFDDTLRVVVSCTLASVRYPDRFQTDEHDRRTFSAGLFAAEMDGTVRAARAFTGLRNVRVNGPGLIEATADRTALSALARARSVAWIREVRVRAPCADIEPFVSLPQPAIGIVPHAADSSGAGVTAAIIEWVQSTSYGRCRAGESVFAFSPPEHSDLTYACLLNTAPAARVVRIGGDSYDAPGVQKTILDSAVETVSMSLVDDDVRDANSRQALVMDDMVYRWPHPVICTPSGNNGQSAEVYWQGYNAINTGSVKHWLAETYVFDEFTQARNPDPVSGSCDSGLDASCAGDREMPELLAPGSHPFSPPGAPDLENLWTDPCVRGYFRAQGTSLSAPIASGCAARLISSAPHLLRARPDAVKMVMMLTAREVDGGYWNAGVDGRDGAGAVDVRAAVEYLRACTTLTNDNNGPVVDGFFSASADSSMAQRRFTVRTPDILPDSSHLRVVLCWTSNPDLNNGRNYLSDLDIGAFNGDEGSYGSYSLDASVEIFDVPREDLTAGRDYSFDMFARVIRIPPGARAQFFYYTLGWTWVKDGGGAVGAGRGSRGDLIRASSFGIRVLENGRVTITIPRSAAPSSALLRLFDMRGRVVFSQSIKVSRTVFVSLPRVARGTYMFEVTLNGNAVRTSAYLR